MGACVAGKEVEGSKADFAGAVGPSGLALRSWAARGRNPVGVVTWSDVTQCRSPERPALGFEAESRWDSEHSGKVSGAYKPRYENTRSRWGRAVRPIAPRQGSAQPAGLNEGRGRT